MDKSEKLTEVISIAVDSRSLAENSVGDLYIHDQRDILKVIVE